MGGYFSSMKDQDAKRTYLDKLRVISGVAKLGHTGARALATGGCAPPVPVQALLKIIGAEYTAVINRELGAKSAQRC